MLKHSTCMALFLPLKNSFMKTLKAILFALTAITAPMSYAEGTMHSATVDVMHLYEGHNGLLLRFSSMSNPDACARNTDAFILPFAYARYKDAFAMLLSAKAARQRVTVTVSGCFEGFPQVRHLYLID